jgi:photosystem II stability/assembly factor-like uncharacterized protein
MPKYIFVVLLIGITTPLCAQPDTLQTPGWRRLSTGVGEPFAHIFVQNPDTVYVSSQSMLLRTHDGGTTWDQLVSDALTRGCIWFIDDTTGLYAPTSDLIYKTTNGGESWRSIATGLSPHVVKHMQFVGRDTGWMLSTVKEMFRTSDQGATWHPSPASGPGSFSFANSSCGYASDYYSDSLERTIDGGRSWISFLPTPIVGAPLAFSPDTVVALKYSTGFQKSADSGKTWVAFSMHGYDLSILTFCPDHLHGWALYRRILHTTDGGQTWSVQEYPGAIIPLFDAGAYSPDVAYAVGDSGVVLKTTNGGESWVDVGPGWSFPMHDNVSPSPAVDRTTLQFNVPSAQRLTVAVYGITGSRVLTLLNDEPQDAGEHELTMDVSGLPSGSYVYTIHGEHCSATGKFTVRH